MKKLLFAVVFSFASLLAHASGIVFLGDSITKGTDYGGVTLTDTFAYKIGTANGYPPASIYNKGVGSDTSAGSKCWICTAKLPTLTSICLRLSFTPFMSILFI